MKTTEQKVELYKGVYAMYDAKKGMDEHIKSGWRVHTCTMGLGDKNWDAVLVVYERKLSLWN